MKKSSPHKLSAEIIWYSMASVALLIIMLVVAHCSR